MKLFIDTADLGEIKKAKQMGVVDGVTTNPSLLARDVKKTPLNDLYKEICDVISGPVSAEVISNSYETMIEEGQKLAQIDKNIVVKIPMTQDGIKAIHFLSKKNIKTNCTLVFSCGQALLAAKAGASYVSPFIGRIDDMGMDGLLLIEDMISVYRNIKNLKTEILAASIRHPIHILECAKMGVDAITAPLKVIESLYLHPLTNIGLQKFLQDGKPFKK